jgi:hypothetical protein
VFGFASSLDDPVDLRGTQSIRTLVFRFYSNDPKNVRLGYRQTHVIPNAEQDGSRAASLLNDKERPSSSTRRRSLPKFVRASSAVTTIPSFIDSPFHFRKLYSSGVSTLRPSRCSEFKTSPLGVFAFSQIETNTSPPYLRLLDSSI